MPSGYSSGGNAAPILFFSFFPFPLHTANFASRPSLPLVKAPPPVAFSVSSDKMARGNQRDKAREANQKKLAAQVRRPPKKGNSMSGTEMQRAKESAAEIMRAKQAAGTRPHTTPRSSQHPFANTPSYGSRGQES
ncbi:4F5 protein family domain-containing protein [Cordyceps javanica]|nr:4F5 protein family domain-containing protein [Cordyceps javanica]